MRILITGACGFIGNSICKLFHEKGYDVTGWDIMLRNKAWNLDYVDLLDEIQVYEKLVQVKPDVIIHCAGSADVSKSVENPDADFRGNVTVTHNLLFAVHKAGMDSIRFIFLSSAGVYGNPSSLPITESMPLNPLSPYALHKVMCENICLYFRKNYGLDAKIIRIFSAYGAGLRKQIFWDMYVKFKKSGALNMFGTGEESRDYINVEDLINAIFLITEKAPEQEVIYNVANGEEITIREAADFFALQCGIESDRIHFSGEKREGDPINWLADISKLKTLGYKKTVDMAEGLKKYVKWVEELND